MTRQICELKGLKFIPEDINQSLKNIFNYITSKFNDRNTEL